MSKHLNSLPFVSYSQNTGFVLHQETIDAITSLKYQKQLSVISMVGKTKTGKSFLLNRLVSQLQKVQKPETQSFEVCSSVDGGTKGLRILPIELQNQLIIVLQMQGLGNLSSNAYSESKLFAIVLLLSSILLYNTNGPLDQQGLQGLSVLVEIGKLLQHNLMSNTLNKLQMPEFYMILRDFALVLEGKNGEPITAEVYFEDALEEQKASTNVAFNKNRIRRVIKDIFRNRNCVTLPFPSDDICIQKGSNLREKFEKELGTLGQTIGKKLQQHPKKINGKNLSIKQWLNFAGQLINSINNQTKQGSLRLQGLVLQVYRQQQKTIRQKFYKKAQYLYKKVSVKIEQTLSNLQLCSQVDLEHFTFSIQRNQQEISLLKKELEESYISSCYEIQELIQKQVGNQKSFQAINFNSTSIAKIKDFAEIYEFKLETNKNIQAKEQELRFKMQQLVEMQNKEKEQQRQKCKFESILLQINLFQNQRELDKLYLTFIDQLRVTNSVFDSKTLESQLLRLQVTYLRRKLQLKDRQQLTKQVAVAKSQSYVLTEKKMQMNQNIFQLVQKKSNLSQKKSNLSQKKSNTAEEYHKNHISAFQSKEINISKGDEQGKKSFLIPYLSIQPQHINIEILRTLVKQDNRGNNFIEYALQVVLLDKRWTFNRRWKDFNQLHNILHQLFAADLLPSFTPGQVLMSEFTFSKKEEIQIRRSRLQSYLRKLLEVDSLRNSRIFQKFLKINKEYVPFI